MFDVIFIFNKQRDPKEPPLTMIPISIFLGNQTTLLSTALSWWWDCSNSIDELARFSLTLAIIILAICWYRWAFIKKAHPPLPPGPRGLPLLGHLPFLQPQLHSYFADLARAHGPIFQLRLGTQVCVVVSSPSLACQILKDQDATFANRVLPDVNLATDFTSSDIVCTQYGPELRMLKLVSVRWILATTTTLDSVSAFRSGEFRRTVADLYSRAGLPTPFREQIYSTVVNVITSSLWGQILSGEEMGSLKEEFKQVMAELSEWLGKPNISDAFPVLAWFDLQGIKKRFKILALRFEEIFNFILDQKMKMDKEDGNRESKGGNDFLQFLLKLKDKGDGKTPLTITHIKALLLDMMVAGIDTTTKTIEFAMAEVMNNADVMKKAQQELDMVVGRESIVEECHIHKLPYLRAVVKEVLRLHPPLPLLLPHSPSETCVMGGYTIPKGVRVIVNMWAIHRDPSIWKNPLQFDPDRFLTGSWDYSGNNFNYFPFGSGRRMCIGTTLAEKMVVFSLATLLHAFDWHLSGEKLDLSDHFGIVSRKKEPLVAIPTPRLSNTTLYG